MLSSSAFQMHTNLFQHTRRAGVIGDTPGGDPLQAEIREAKVQDATRGFCGIAFSPMPGIQFISHIPFQRLDRAFPDTAISNELPAGFQRDRQLKFEAWFLLLMIQKHLNEFTHLVGSSRVPLAIAQVERFLLVCKHRFPIVFYKLPQDESFAGQDHRLYGFRLQDETKFNLYQSALTGERSGCCSVNSLRGVKKTATIARRAALKAITNTRWIAS